jgi:hypothetical protein
MLVNRLTKPASGQVQSPRRHMRVPHVRPPCTRRRRCRRRRGVAASDVKGKGAYVRQAIDALLSEQNAVEFREGPARMVKLERNFRETDEWNPAPEREVVSF